jgi:hypothetical protein
MSRGQPTPPSTSRANNVCKQIGEINKKTNTTTCNLLPSGHVGKLQTEISSFEKQKEDPQISLCGLSLLAVDIKARHRKTKAFIKPSDA